MTVVKGLKALRDQYRKAEFVDWYEKRRFSSFLGKLTHDMEIKATNSALEQNHPAKLLEIAVGPGRISKNIDFFDMGVGIDTSKPFLEIAKKNVRDNRWNFLNADAMNMPFHNSSFDAIVTFRLIRHFTKEEREKAYQEIHRVLRGGGILIIDALNNNSGIITKFFDKIHIFATQLITGTNETTYDCKYTREELKKELFEAGFEVKFIYGIIHAYNLYFLLNLPFDAIRYIKMKQKKDPGNIYKKLRDMMLSIALPIEYSRKQKNSYSWVVICQKK